MNNQIFGYPLLSWLPIILMFTAFILYTIDNSRYSGKGRPAAIRKIAIGICVIASTILTFIFKWRECWIVLLACILAMDRLFSGIKMLRNPESQSKKPLT